MSHTFRMALCQMYVKPGDMPANLRRARGLIEQAAAGGAQVVVLPEAMDCGWTHPSARTLASPIPRGDTFKTLAEAATKHRVYVCSGLIERDSELLFNAAVLIGPD